MHDEFAPDEFMLDEEVEDTDDLGDDAEEEGEDDPLADEEEEL
jgi:hypothetical protein